MDRTQARLVIIVNELQMFNNLPTQRALGSHRSEALGNLATQVIKAEMMRHKGPESFDDDVPF